MTEEEIMDAGPELVREIMSVFSRHLIVGQLPESDRKCAAEGAVFDLLCVYRDRFSETN